MERTSEAENLYSIVENIICGICVFALGEERKLMPVYLNEGMYRMLGYSHKELEMMIKNIRRVVIPEDLPVFEQGINDILKDDGAAEFEFRTVTGDGSLRWLQVRGNLYGKEDGYPLMAGVVLDVTERKSIEEQLALQAERLNILSSSVKEHIIDYNVRTDVLSVKLESSALSHGDIVLESFIQKGGFKSVHPEDIDFLNEMMNASIKTQLSDSLAFRSTFFEKDDDEYHWYRVNITSVRGTEGYITRVVGRVVNIDDEKARERELQIRADVDSLTGLYNKGAATTLITDALKKSAADNTKCAMMMLDLDHFKSINDTFGHAVGDSVIQEAGRILKDTFKGRDIVGRMGGDEFMVFMVDIKGVKDAEIIAGKLNEILTRTYSDSSHKVTVTASIGIAMSDGNEVDFNSLYQLADKALYHTKENGRNGNSVYGTF